MFSWLIGPLFECQQARAAKDAAFGCGCCDDAARAAITRRPCILNLTRNFNQLCNTGANIVLMLAPVITALHCAKRTGAAASVERRRARGSASPLSARMHSALNKSDQITTHAAI